MYLNCHTWHSLRYGTFSEEALCQLAVQHGVKSIAVTDINSTTACLRFYQIAKKYQLNPLVGVDFRNGNKQLYIGIAQSTDGYYALNSYLSQHLHDKSDFPDTAPFLKDCVVIYPFTQVKRLQKTMFLSYEYIGVSLTDLAQFKFSEYKQYTDRLVFQQPVTFRTKKDYNAHRLLRAIDQNTLLSKLSVTEQGHFSDQMHGLDKVDTAFKDFEFILDNTQKLIESCHIEFSIDPGLNKNLQVFTESKSNDIKRIRTLCKQRLHNRYPQPSRKILKRVARELQIIIDLGFVSYFLISLDIVEYARSQNYAFVGRGSGANSVVAHILGITNVDPIELDLYFERFINPNRSLPPDFDIDFSWKDRDDVMRYIFERYPHTALMGTYVTFKKKAVIRELGKVFGLPKANIDRLVTGRMPTNQLDELERLVLKYGEYIKGFPNYRSVHSGGVLILNEPVHRFAATFLPPKGFPTTQIDMHIAEEIGIHKFDILAQRGVSKITDAVEIIKQNQPQASLADINQVNIFKNDPKINQLLKTGDCMGVFYVESPAMRSLLIQLQTDNYLSLVAASSIIRPAVSYGGMKATYIQRERCPEKRKEAHPVLYQIMPETYGVMVYQEDVMKVAHQFAGLDLDDADVLRRGMSGKSTPKGEMERIEQRFKTNCKQRGYSDKLIDEVWHQIASFAGYAFPKGHSASYAVESYQSLYLKCYFPLEFMVAVLNNGGGFYGVETYLQEIRNCGGQIQAPDINKSNFETTIEGKVVFLGLGYIKNLELQTAQRIIEERNFGGSFLSLTDFIRRVPIGIEQISTLITIEAFRFTGQNKYELLWNALFILQKSAVKSTVQAQLFTSKPKTFTLPEFTYSKRQQAYDQLEVLGFHLQHPFSLLQHKITSGITAQSLSKYIGQKIVIYGDLITIKHVRTKNNKHMAFGTFYDYEFDIFDTVHFPRIVRHYPIYGKGVYKCIGKVKEEFGYVSITLDSIVKMAMRNRE